MEMACTLQETYNIWSWLLPLISGSIGALIGTYGGAYFLHGKQEQKVKNIRAMAVKALDILKTYKTYADAINEFNTKLNVSEKRAVTVALHKLGVPFETPTKDALDIKNIRLKEAPIDKDEIDAMIVQIEKGNCDNQFFLDIESYFTSNLRLNAVRNVGKKYVKEVLARSHIDISNPNKIINPDRWFESFTPGEFQTILVLRDHLANIDYFTANGIPDPIKIEALIREIEIGLWDNYLFWDYESFMNIRAQYNLADVIQDAFKMNQQQTNTNTEQKKA